MLGSLYLWALNSNLLPPLMMHYSFLLSFTPAPRASGIWMPAYSTALTVCSALGYQPRHPPSSQPTSENQGHLILNLPSPCHLLASPFTISHPMIQPSSWPPTSALTSSTFFTGKAEEPSKDPIHMCMCVYPIYICIYLICVYI